jgi:acetyltransferase EpsM
MSGVIILGTGNHAKVACDILLEMGLTVRGFLGDDESMHGKDLMGFPVLGPIDSWKTLAPAALALGAGSNELRKDLMARCEGATWVTMIHPRANLSRFARIGEGTMVAFGACIGPLAHVGRGAIINTKASVDHDCVVGDYAHIAVGATLAGTVSVGEGAMVGAGATVIQNLEIGEWSVVGAGAAVIRPVPAGVTVVGVPARAKP